MSSSRSWIRHPLICSAISVMFSFRESFVLSGLHSVGSGVKYLADHICELAGLGEEVSCFRIFVGYF